MKVGCPEPGLHPEVEEFGQGPAVTLAGPQHYAFLPGQLDQGLPVAHHRRRDAADGGQGFPQIEAAPGRGQVDHLSLVGEAADSPKAPGPLR